MKVKCLETGIVYKTLFEAGKAMGLRSTLIGRVCSGQRGHTGHYHFEYVFDDPKPKKESKPKVHAVYAVHHCARCRKEFSTWISYQRYCCKKCQQQDEYERRCEKRGHVPKPVPNYIDRPFTRDTDMMIVRDVERGKTFGRVAEATSRSERSIAERYMYLKQSGEYELLKQTTNEMPRHEAGRRIA